MEKFNNYNNSNLKDIVHDLKTPITSIMGFIELLKQGDYDKKSTSEFYDIILDESQKLLRMVNNILYTCKEDNQSDNICNLNIQIDKYVKELAPLARKRNIDIKINISSSNIYVSIPEDKMSRILTNIIENAIKYNKEHGKIFIDVYEENEYVFVKIRDTGIGIPESEIGDVFNKYYRSSVSKKLSVEGSGLGLAIARDIVKEYKGNIKLTSVLNQYTEFIISFPISRMEK